AAGDAGSAAKGRAGRRGAARPVEDRRDLILATRIGNNIRRTGVVAGKPAYVIREGLAISVGSAVIARDRAEWQRGRRFEPGRCKLDVVQRRRFDGSVGRRAEPLFDPAEHEGFFVRRQTFAFPAPTKILQPRLRHDRSPSVRIVSATIPISDLVISQKYAIILEGEAIDPCNKNNPTRCGR